MPQRSQRLSRRDFLKTSAAVVGAAAATGGLAASAPSPALAASNNDLDFATALEAARAIRAKDVTSLELTERMLERIEEFDDEINAVVLRFADDARVQARKADEAWRRGEWRGPFHGVPMTMKEMIGMRGILTTSGAPELKDFRPDYDATVVARMRAAGGVILGKTNVPLHALDMQTYNVIYGTTNNPYDLERTCGGSTGGGAAALAAGMTYLSTGSDIGGSIREPSNFCGVYGHKPTLDVVPKTGYNPPGPPHVPNALSVAGPLARSAADLKAALQVLGGPDGFDAIAYEWTLPQARGNSLKDYRVRFVLDDPVCPVVPEVKELLGKAVRALEDAGAQVEEGWPQGVNPREQIELYLRLLMSSIPPTPPPAGGNLENMQLSEINLMQVFMDMATMSYRDMQDLHNQRIQARHTWQTFFESHDAFLMPVNFVPAFPHDHSEPMPTRKLETSLGDRSYLDLLYWISFATMTGLPATAAPIGQTGQGLPVGIQILGPYLEDATPIDIAGRLTELVGGFQPPPRYAS